MLSYRVTAQFRLLAIPYTFIQSHLRKFNVSLSSFQNFLTLSSIQHRSLLFLRHIESWLSPEYHNHTPSRMDFSKLKFSYLSLLPLSSFNDRSDGQRSAGMAKVAEWSVSVCSKGARSSQGVPILAPNCRGKLMEARMVFWECYFLQERSTVIQIMLQSVIKTLGPCLLLYASLSSSCQSYFSILVITF